MNARKKNMLYLKSIKKDREIEGGHGRKKMEVLVKVEGHIR